MDAVDITPHEPRACASWKTATTSLYDLAALHAVAPRRTLTADVARRRPPVPQRGHQALCARREALAADPREIDERRRDEPERQRRAEEVPAAHRRHEQHDARSPTSSHAPSTASQMQVAAGSTRRDGATTRRAAERKAVRGTLVDSGRLWRTRCCDRAVSPSATPLRRRVPPDAGASRAIIRGTEDACKPHFPAVCGRPAARRRHRGAARQALAARRGARLPRRRRADRPVRHQPDRQHRADQRRSPSSASC